jgi:hypothetical protein
MNISWKIDLSEEPADRGHVEEITMSIIKAFRAIKYAQPYRIKIKAAGIGPEVFERILAAGLPAVLK